MPARLWIGTSGWHYRHWREAFYPEKMSSAKMLAHYAQEFDTVEINNTFYRLPEKQTFADWAATAPSGFRFAVKASRFITHIKRLKNSEEFLQRFISTIEPLSQAGKIGCVLFQLPPNLKADPKLLQDFLPAIPRGVKAAFEFRHESWFADDIFSCLKQHNRALCVAETEERGTPDVVTADFCYYRYRKPEYTPEERQAMLRRMQEHLSNGRDSYAYFKHEETPQGAIYAVDVLKQAGTAPA